MPPAGLPPLTSERFLTPILLYKYQQYINSGIEFIYLFPFPDDGMNALQLQWDFDLHVRWVL